MTPAPNDPTSIFSALAWPLVVVAALFFFRHSVANLAKLASERIRKVSFAGFDLEFATLRNVTPASLDVELRQMSGTPIAESGSSSMFNFVNALYGAPPSYVVVDLGSKDRPQWLTSRVYLFAYLIMLIDESIVMVFVETSGATRRRYTGLARARDVRWALAGRYPWLEPAMAGAYASLASNIFVPSPDPTVQPQANPYGPLTDTTTGRLQAHQAAQLITAFLRNVQVASLPQNAPADRLRDWVQFKGGQFAEYAVWLDPDRLERRLGEALSRASVVVPVNESLDGLGTAVLKQSGRYVAILNSELRFEGLLDRQAVLDLVARDYSMQVRTAQRE
jgi:hypothetical protein